jgi:diketogulonate reductase-like aldo/keto reductase
VAQRRCVTPARVALTWLPSQPCVMPIPKVARLLHLRSNRATQDTMLCITDLQTIDRHCPTACSTHVLSVC